ncbi:MAG: sulfatase-like hydrolase/transferase [Paludibacteraceae bacterium]|nr:sulfatase-like hydrolase/transferase [Paludibacteraceae bacterium]
MKERLKFILFYFVFWLIIFVLQKPIFLIFQLSKDSFADWIGTITHGFCMDLSMSGYCTLLPLVLTMVSCFLVNDRWIRKAIDIYTYLLIGFVSLLFVADLFLYRYWGFRIDNTPLFYLKTPKDAMASGSWYEYIAALILLAIFIFVLVKFYHFMRTKWHEYTSRSYLTLIPLTLIFGVMFILIRGGIGVSTMNAGYVYFSESTFLNHAAINPTWNFINSCTRSNNFDKQYRFLEEGEAVRLVNELNATNATIEDTLTGRLLNTNRPNILLIIMEGIGSNMIETLGGKPGVAPNLCRYTQEGICFTNFFASSFRTDRGLVAILSGYPAQPTNSLMKFPNKTQNVPILTQDLRSNGYHTAFYYGGDDNFTNLHSYLVTAGYQTIVNEHDFTGKEMSTKWGAYDHVVLNRVKKDLHEAEQPFFKTVLTLNSHEPFDVPSHVLEEPYPNSVHYTDSCIGDFIEDYKKQEIWKNSLIIILPDHAFRYPATLDNATPWRYRIPMIWLGGAIDSIQTITKTCGQVDIAATLLNQLKIPSERFTFSHDIMSPSHPEYAFYSFIDGFGLITQKDTSIYDCGANRTLRTTHEETIEQGKAYLQKLYDDLSLR